MARYTKNRKNINSKIKLKKNRKSRVNKQKNSLYGGSTLTSNTNSTTKTLVITYSTANITIATENNNNKNLTTRLSELQTQPEIQITNLNATENYIMVMHDPDAPVGNWLHWLYLQTGNDKTKRQVIVPYMGPKPPAGSGRHNYIFNVYRVGDADIGTEIEKMKSLLQNPKTNNNLAGIRGNQTILNGLMNYLKTKKIVASSKQYYIES